MCKPKLTFGLILLALLLLLSGCSSGEKSNAPAIPMAKNGLLDLRGWQFDKNGPVALNGQWEFYWEQLLAPEDFANPPSTTPEFFHLPGIWNAGTDTRKALPAQGYATYRLVIRSDSILPAMALEIPDTYCSYKLYVNGEIFTENGLVSSDPQTAVPYWLPFTQSLYVEGQQTELIIQVSNYHHSKGGIKETIFFGTETQLSQRRETILALDLMLTGSLIMGGLFFLGLYLFGQKERSIIYFALFCLTYSYRIIGYDLYFFNSLFPDIGWEVTIRLEYIALFFGPALFAGFVYELYPRETSLRLIRFFQTVCILLIILVFATPATIFSQAVTPYIILLVIYLLYGFYVFSRAAYNKRDGANYAVISFIMMFIAIFLTIGSHFAIIESSPFIPFFGHIGFFFFQSLILSYRFAENLHRAADAAEAGARAKSEFLATMSHEIRTPMNGVIGMTTLLSETRLSKKQNEYVDSIRISGENLLTIINDILDFSKIESRKLDLEFQNTKLSECLASVLTLLASEADEKKLTLNYTIGDRVPDIIITDPVRLRQILVNLVSNGIKFTEKGGIDLAVSILEKQGRNYTLQFQVRDSGIGMPPEMVERLFRPFTQGDASMTRRFGGTGLGLAICKMLVEMMGGRIWTESKEGEGSTFFFTIAAETGREFSLEDRQKLLEILRGKHALVIADNLANLTVQVTRLNNWEVSTIGIDRPEEVDGIMQLSETFDFALIDAAREDTDVLLLAEKIRSGSAKNQLPIVLITNDLPENHADEILPKTEWLQKPLRSHLLLMTIAELLVPQKQSGTIIQTDRLNKIKSGLIKPQYALKILLAEDNSINQKVASQNLSKLGFPSEIATDGRQALNAISRNDYDLVFMDIQMPEMDGLETTAKVIEQFPDPADRPVIVAMTANAMKGDRERCLASGMDDYIAKPIRREMLVQIIQRWFPDIYQ